MNVRTLALTASLLAVAGLVGCSSSDEKTAPPPPAPAPAPVAAPAAPPPPPPPAKPMHAQPSRAAKVQTALNANGAQLSVDGRMGPKTVAAVKAFQQQHKLKATGKVDSATAKALGV
jgi:peptidoglycan hydrolase-like protein with peptidoglycan-binding domain